MDFMLWCLNLAWKVMLVCMGWMLFRYIVKNGKGTFGEVLDTIGIALKTMGHAIRKACLSYLKKEESASKTKMDEVDYRKAYEEYLKKKEQSILTFEDFCEAMKESESFTLD